jgi:hypothetical protein
MTDIVNELRSFAQANYAPPIMHRAADEIERLRRDACLTGAGFTMQKEIARAVAAERAAILEILRGYIYDGASLGQKHTAERIAAAIKARGTE